MAVPTPRAICISPWRAPSGHRGQGVSAEDTQSRAGHHTASPWGWRAWTLKHNVMITQLPPTALAAPFRAGDCHMWVQHSKLNWEPLEGGLRLSEQTGASHTRVFGKTNDSSMTSNFKNYILHNSLPSDKSVPGRDTPVPSSADGLCCCGDKWPEGLLAAGCSEATPRSEGTPRCPVS